MSHLFVQQTLSLYHDVPVSFRGLLNWHSPVQKIINKNSSSSFNCKGKSLHSEHHEQNSLLNACRPVENHNVFANIPFNNFSEEKEKKQLEAAYLYGLRCYIRIKHFNYRNINSASKLVFFHKFVHLVPSSTPSLCLTQMLQKLPLAVWESLALETYTYVKYTQKKGIHQPTPPPS